MENGRNEKENGENEMCCDMISKNDRKIICPEANVSAFRNDIHSDNKAICMDLNNMTMNKSETNYRTQMNVRSQNTYRFTQ